MSGKSYPAKPCRECGDIIPSFTCQCDPEIECMCDQFDLCEECFADYADSQG